VGPTPPPGPLPTDLPAARAADLHASFASQLAMDRAMIHDAAGRHADSVAAWDAALALHHCFRSQKQAGRALALAGAGDVTQAVSQAKEAAADRDLPVESYCDLARAYCRCAKTVSEDDRRESLYKEALAFLRAARAQRFGDLPDHMEVLKRHPDLEPLRRRADFLTTLPPPESASDR
jgi:hypothetical protein